MKSPLILILFTFLSFQVVAQVREQEETSPEDIEHLLNTDSLKISNPADSLNQEVGNLNSKIGAIQDSISIKTQIDLPDSLLSKNPLDTIKNKIEAPQQKINAIADSLQQKLQVKVPDSLKSLIPKEADLLPELNVPELEIDPLENIGEIKEIEALESLQDIPNVKEINDLNPLDEVGEISELDQLDDITDQAKEIKGMVPEKENLAETVENEAKNIKGVKVLEEQKGVQGDMPEGLDQLQDQEHYKEELINTAKEKAVDHFAGHGDKLQAAQSKLADIKRKYPEGVSSIKDLPKRRMNPLKGKPFKERLLLGLTLQIHPDQIPNVDLSPFLAYKISPRLSMGLGGNYRLMTKPKFKGLTTEGAVYGYRGFAEFMIHKGFFVHAEYEMLKTLVRDSIYFQSTEKKLEKEWIDGLFLGIGKEYKIAGMVKGNMQVLYNFLNEPNSPYQDKVMVRFGFSFQLKDKIKKPDISPEVEKVKERVKEKGKESLKSFKGKEL